MGISQLSVSVSGCVTNISPVSPDYERTKVQQRSSKQVVLGTPYKSHILRPRRMREISLACRTTGRTYTRVSHLPMLRLLILARYSIDLSKPWTNSSVSLRSIYKQSPPLNAEALWLDAAGETFYSFDGYVSLTLPYAGQAPQSASFWKFTPDSGGRF